MKVTDKELSNYSDKQAIREILGSFLQEPKLIKEYKVVKADFPERFHKVIFATISNLYQNGAEEIDAVAIDDYLSHYNEQYVVFNKNNRGIEFIDSVKEMAVPSNIKYYYDRLKKFSLLRSCVKSGTDVSYFFNPKEIDPLTIENQQTRLDESTTNMIISYLKKQFLGAVAPFAVNGDRDSKKAGVGGAKQKELWKNSTAWGLSLASEYMTTIFHGSKKRRFNVMSAGTGVGKTRISMANLASLCAPKLYNKELNKWLPNPNGIKNGGLYIGTEMELLEEIDPILWAYMADVPQDHIEFNTYEGDEEERVDEAIRLLAEEANIWLEYIPEYDLSTLEAVIEEHKLKHEVEHVFFDYIHTTVELLSEFAHASKVKMAVREDQILAQVSSTLKTLTRRYDISLDTGTQVSGDFKNSENRDSTIVRGSKAIIDKADGAYIAMPPTAIELKKIEDIMRTKIDCPIPNIVLSVYKNRGGKWNNIKVWLYIDYGTMRIYDLFVTDYDCHPDSDKVKGLEKTIITIKE